jgi:hypothetical protein
MNTIEQIIHEYKKAREARNIASIKNDTHAINLFNDELSYWSNKLTEEIEKTGVSIKKVRAMINE